MLLSQVAGKVGLDFSGHDIDVCGVNTLTLPGRGRSPLAASQVPAPARFYAGRGGPV
jgi:hypothetical protein